MCKKFFLYLEKFNNNNYNDYSIKKKQKKKKNLQTGNRHKKPVNDVQKNFGHVWYQKYVFFFVFFLPVFGL